MGLLWKNGKIGDIFNGFGNIKIVFIFINWCKNKINILKIFQNC